jgi:hypothetical protein
MRNTSVKIIKFTLNVHIVFATVLQRCFNIACLLRKSHQLKLTKSSKLRETLLIVFVLITT